MARIDHVGPDDWQAWRAVRLRALQDAPDAFYTRYADVSGPNDREQYWRGYFTPNGRNYLASVDGTAVGLARIVGPHEGADAELMSLWVAPETRRLGVGSELLETCWNWLQATAPGRPLRLAVRRGNQTARRLYEHLGFTYAGPNAEDAIEDVLIRR